MAYDSEIFCKIYIKGKALAVERTFTWSFLMNGLVKVLYEEFGDQWTHCEPFFADTMNMAYGYLLNSSELKDKINKKLAPQDFDRIIKYNHRIKCQVFFSSEEAPTIYLIDKKSLIETFVKGLYDLYGNDWIYFDTFFEDTGNVAYGTIWNDSTLRRKQYLTPCGLRQRHRNHLKASYKATQFETFYLLYFTNPALIKIGRTFQIIEKRLYNYIFPSSIFELKLYAESHIDFTKSFIAETDISREEFQAGLRTSFEKQYKKSLRKRSVKNILVGKQRRLEIFNTDDYDFLFKKCLK